MNSPSLFFSLFRPISLLVALNTFRLSFSFSQILIQILLWVPSEFKSLQGGSLFIPTATCKKMSTSLCVSFTPLDNPAVVFSGPLCGCCSLATASLPPSTAYPHPLYLFTPVFSNLLYPNSPHTHELFSPLPHMQPSNHIKPAQFPCIVCFWLQTLAVHFPCTASYYTFVVH